MHHAIPWQRLRLTVFDISRWRTTLRNKLVEAKTFPDNIHAKKYREDRRHCCIYRGWSDFVSCKTSPNITAGTGRSAFSDFFCSGINCIYSSVNYVAHFNRRLGGLQHG